MPEVSILMPCYNRGYDLAHVLEAYDLQSTHSSFEVIAVDDASTDNTYQLLTSYCPRNYLLRVFRLEKNSGPASARNRGLLEVNSPLIIMVGDDILPTKDFVLNHELAHKKYFKTEYSILGKLLWANDIPINTLMKHIDGAGAEQFSYYYLKPGTVYDFRHFYTSNISIKREMLFRVKHFFDTDFQYPAYEDVELSYRLSQKGMKIIYDDCPVAYHYHYHTIWSFSERQYRCGQMAILLIKKHPLSSSNIVNFRRIGKLFLKGIFTLEVNPYEYTQIEEKILLLASNYEWSKIDSLDSIYLEILNYYYYRGVIYGIFGPGRLGQKITTSFTQANLPHLLELFAEGERSGISERSL
jgi:glycosyltransferase involved in cell wall biosynthesis